MSGLDKMKAQIIAEAQDNAKEILAQAHAQADSIIGEAKAQAEKDARKIVAQAEARAEDSVKRLASSSDMRKRKAVLEAKQEVISEVLEDAYKAVGELDDAAYFAMLEKVLEKYVLPEEGTICFTEKDRKRMPQGYMEKVYETVCIKHRRKKDEIAESGGNDAAYLADGLPSFCRVRRKGICGHGRAV